MTAETEVVGVAGLRLLGRGIAACLLSRGFLVVAYTRGAETRAEARAYIAGGTEEETT